PERVCELGEGVQCPNERKPICFTGRVQRRGMARLGHARISDWNLKSEPCPDNARDHGEDHEMGRGKAPRQAAFSRRLFKWPLLTGMDRMPVEFSSPDTYAWRHEHPCCGRKARDGAAPEGAAFDVLAAPSRAAGQGRAFPSHEPRRDDGA